MIPFRFLLSGDPLDPAGLSRLLDDPSCGGFATFEGRVRDRAGGGAVAHLEYQAHAALCGKIGTEIVQTAIGRFGLGSAILAHRTGILRPGEAAIWIGVRARRRSELFSACSWILESAKHDLPVWKREVLADGSSSWISESPDLSKNDPTNTERRSPCDPTPSHPPSAGR